MRQASLQCKMVSKAHARLVLSCRGPGAIRLVGTATQIRAALRKAGVVVGGPRRRRRKRS